MKLYLTNIFVNYDIFYQEMKNIGFSEDLPKKIRNINELEIILEDLIDNIIIFNELINIESYLFIISLRVAEFPFISNLSK